MGHLAGPLLIMLVNVAYYASSIAFFWRNYGKIMLFFPNYAPFLKLCSLKKMQISPKNTTDPGSDRFRRRAVIHSELKMLLLEVKINVTKCLGVEMNIDQIVASNMIR